MTKINLIKPYISYDEVETQLKDIFESGFFTKGKNVQKFVTGLRNYTGAKHAFLTTSATTALTMCLQLIKVGQGDKVLVSDFSFPASANVVEDLGATPIFVDVDKDSFNMSVENLKKKISSDIKAIIFVDALGNPTNITEVMAVARSYGIPVIQDSACSIGSSVDGVKIGNVADLTCFSFHPRKLLCTGEGGAITTNSARYAELLDIKLNHGASGMKGIGLDFVDYGYNYRMSEIQALMGHIQLAKIDDVVAERIHTYKAYEERLLPLGFLTQHKGDEILHNVQSAVFMVPEHISQSELISYLGERDIEATLGTYCLSGTTYYHEKYDDIQPNAQWLQAHTITLPCYKDIDVDRVCEEIEKFMK